RSTSTTCATRSTAASRARSSAPSAAWGTPSRNESDVRAHPLAPRRLDDARGRAHRGRARRGRLRRAGAEPDRPGRPQPGRPRRRPGAQGKPGAPPDKPAAGQPGGPPPQGAALLVGQSLAPEERALRSLLTILVVAVVGGLLAALGGAWFLAGRALVPIQQAF